MLGAWLLIEVTSIPSLCRWQLCMFTGLLPCAYLSTHQQWNLEARQAFTIVPALDLRPGL